MSKSIVIRNKILDYITKEVANGVSIIELFRKFSNTTLPDDLRSISVEDEEQGYRFAQLELSRLLQHPEKMTRPDGKRAIGDQDLDAHLLR
jgi:hypothetical protein